MDKYIVQIQFEWRDKTLALVFEGISCYFLTSEMQELIKNEIFLVLQEQIFY